MSHTGRVSDTKSLTGREAPRWLIAVVAVVGVLLLAYLGCQALMGREGEPGPRIQVHPGMYDLRSEVAKMRAAHQAESAPNGR
jgi:hypothetical protein